LHSYNNHPAGLQQQSNDEDADLLTDDLSADPYETCDTQTDDEPKEKEVGKTESTIW
jgi:hypothetical protein